MFSNNINQFFKKRPSPKDREQRQERGCLKIGLKETWGSHGMWLGAGETKTTGYEDAGIADLPSFERGDSVAFLH